MCFVAPEFKIQFTLCLLIAEYINAFSPIWLELEQELFKISELVIFAIKAANTNELPSVF